MARPYIELLDRIRADRRARWQALGVVGRFRFRVRDCYAIARYRIAAAWEILRHGDEDEHYARPSLDRTTDHGGRDGY